jgi:hypothetical protein
MNALPCDISVPGMDLQVGSSSSRSLFNPRSRSSRRLAVQSALHCTTLTFWTENPNVHRIPSHPSCHDDFQQGEARRPRVQDSGDPTILQQGKRPSLFRSQSRLRKTRDSSYNDQSQETSPPRPGSTGHSLLVSGLSGPRLARLRNHPPAWPIALTVDGGPPGGTFVVSRSEGGRATTLSRAVWSNIHSMRQRAPQESSRMGDCTVSPSRQGLSGQSRLWSNVRYRRRGVLRGTAQELGVWRVCLIKMSEG